MHNKLTLKEIQKISFDILIDVARYCDENNITYYLSCGTLLGCIKYEGFIPWDDDVDIMMPRTDYEKFIATYKGKYTLLDPSEGMFFYAKVYDKKTIEYEKDIDYKKNSPIGVSLDIFPLDGIVSDKKVLDKQNRISGFLQSLFRLSNQPVFYKNSILRVFNRIIARLIGSKNIYKTLNRVSKKYNYDKCDYVIRYKDTSNGVNKPLHKEIYRIERKKFEGIEFNVPSGYDIWLKSFYGDNYVAYTPDIKDRKSHNKDVYYI